MTGVESSGQICPKHWLSDWVSEKRQESKKKKTGASGKEKRNKVTMKTKGRAKVKKYTHACSWQALLWTSSFRLSTMSTSSARSDFSFSFCASVFSDSVTKQNKIFKFKFTTSELQQNYLCISSSINKSNKVIYLGKTAVRLQHIWLSLFFSSSLSLSRLVIIGIVGLFVTLMDGLICTSGKAAHHIHSFCLMDYLWTGWVALLLLLIFISLPQPPPCYLFI